MARRYKQCQIESNNRRSNKERTKKINRAPSKNVKMQVKRKIIKENKSKFKMFLKILLIIFLLLCVIGAGIIAAMLFGFFGDDFEITKEELTSGDSNTIILDKFWKRNSKFKLNRKKKNNIFKRNARVFTRSLYSNRR